MKQKITVRGVPLAVPEDERPVRRGGKRGRTTDLPLNEFVFSLLSENERLLHQDGDRPCSDLQLREIIVDEFSEHETVVNAFRKGTYSIAQFRSRYRKGQLVSGRPVVYWSFAYRNGEPCDATGGRFRPLTIREFLEELQKCPNDPRIPEVKTAVKSGQTSPPSWEAPRKKHSS